MGWEGECDGFGLKEEERDDGYTYRVSRCGSGGIA